MESTNQRSDLATTTRTWHGPNHTHSTARRCLEHPRRSSGRTALTRVPMPCPQPSSINTRQPRAPTQRRRRAPLRLCAVCGHSVRTSRHHRHRSTSQDAGRSMGMQRTNWQFQIWQTRVRKTVSQPVVCGHWPLLAARARTLRASLSEAQGFPILPPSSIPHCCGLSTLRGVFPETSRGSGQGPGTMVPGDGPPPKPKHTHRQQYRTRLQQPRGGGQRIMGTPFDSD